MHTSGIHARLAEVRPDVSRGEDTVEAAAWELISRCLSLANALLLLLAEGYIVQSDMLHRAFLETSDVLDAIVTPEEHELRDRWLGDEGLSFATTARAMERLERRLIEADVMPSPPAHRVRFTAERAYALLSSGAHARRSKIRRSVLSSSFAYSTESHWVERAVTILFAAGSVAFAAVGFSRALAHSFSGAVDEGTDKLPRLLLERVGELAGAMERRLATPEDCG